MSYDEVGSGFPSICYWIVSDKAALFKAASTAFRRAIIDWKREKSEYYSSLS